MNTSLEKQSEGFDHVRTIPDGIKSLLMNWPNEAHLQEDYHKNFVNVMAQLLQA